jgi:hypothetical protein
MQIQSLATLPFTNSKNVFRNQKNMSFGNSASKPPENAGEFLKHIDAKEAFPKAAEEGINDYALTSMKSLKEAFTKGDTVGGFKILGRIGELCKNVIDTPLAQRRINNNLWIPLNTLGNLDSSYNPLINRHGGHPTKETVLRVIEQLKGSSYGEAIASV